MLRIMKWTALFSLLTGCGGTKPDVGPPAPGTSIKLQYPVLLAGGENHDIRVMDDEETLTTTRMAAGAVYMNRKIIDAGGGLYEVVKEVAPGAAGPAWRDLGTSNHRVHLELRHLRDVGLDQTKQILLDVIQDPRSFWSLYPGGAKAAGERVRGFPSLSELIEGCRASSEWSR